MACKRATGAVSSSQRCHATRQPGRGHHNCACSKDPATCPADWGLHCSYCRLLSHFKSFHLDLNPSSVISPDPLSESPFLCFLTCKMQTRITESPSEGRSEGGTKSRRTKRRASAWSASNVVAVLFFSCAPSKFQYSKPCRDHTRPECPTDCRKEGASQGTRGGSWLQCDRDQWAEHSLSAGLL